MTYRKTESTTVAAAKASFSAATGYRIEDDPRTRRHPRAAYRQTFDVLLEQLTERQAGRSMVGKRQINDGLA